MTQLAPSLINTDKQFKAAGDRFKRFFEELGGFFIEREEVLSQIALALLAREHVLLTGPPGNAKSQIATAVLRRIIDEKTGEASVFSRQFTESTIQTDLVGPVDFKTLMESGRTEHFTDEGMLGAVHAFLDEVFDGRDMLLRSALNILQERELKQGSKTTKGAIECAIMTSNRYLAELLEGSRDTLLAFIDRIAFISFVPKGFAEPNNLSFVLRRQLSGEHPAILDAPLLIQDLDILQTVTEEVYVSEEICNALAQLLIFFDEEVNSAVRADPNYIPTRYLSTRTAVRAGKILKAICIYDKIFTKPDRPLEVLPGDLNGLCLHLLLGGQNRDRVAKLLAQEADPRERRQLEIVRTERELFDRCISRLPQITIRPRPQATPNKIKELRRNATSTNPALLLQAAKELTTLSSWRSNNAAEAKEALKDVVESLSRLALQKGFSPSQGQESAPEKVAAELAGLANHLEDASGQNRPLARWLRSKALSFIEEAALLAPLATEGTALPAQQQNEPVQNAITISDWRLARLESLHQLRVTLTAQGTASTNTNAWRKALSRIESELRLLWDEILRFAVVEALSRTSKDSLPKLLELLGPAFAYLDKIGGRLENLGLPKNSFKLAVVGPRLNGLLKASFDKFDGQEKGKLLSNVTALLKHLDNYDLKGMVAPKEIIGWSAEAVIRGEQQRTPPNAEKFDKRAFQKLREFDALFSTNTLLEIGLLVSPEIVNAPQEPNATIRALHTLLRDLAPQVAAKIGEGDMMKIERQLDFLEGWYQTLCPENDAELSATNAVSLLELFLSSGYLQLLRQEAIGVHLSVAAKNIAEIFPELSTQAQRLCERLEQLEENTSALLLQLSTKRADKAWSNIFSKK